eukprot:TRINITY_DN3142_c0_g1_i1.p1 TRINITY_DN3142_c0_g1~~TRINITY_DN3142_c0_g1_i1.p1  ORF type:complete len:635 (-),score=207.11 TRINITY_DN3142_c0_g1_i1:77-1714(-)
MERRLHQTRMTKHIFLGVGPQPAYTAEDLTPAATVVALIQPDKFQAAAIDAALSNSFTVIQGPPGTGKTRTGVLLARKFAAVNRSLQDRVVRFNMQLAPNAKPSKRPVVMYCGPSNKSVDVVAERLVEHKDLKVVRVYASSIEVSDLKLHWKPVSFRDKKQFVVPPELKDSSLHHLVRSRSSFGPDIRTMEAEFADPDFKVTDEDIQRHAKIVSEAQAEILSTADVVGCTCYGAGSGRVTRSVRPQQTIIDECGQAVEPECLMAILRAEQVVLSGDDKQLGPVILSQDVLVGWVLRRSLFTRHAKAAIPLLKQYRMHGSIRVFPSDKFYNSKLEDGIDVMPILGVLGMPLHFATIFCDVVGSDLSSRNVLGGGGYAKQPHLAPLIKEALRSSLTSRCNPEEATKVVNVIRMLQRLSIAKPDDVFVITPYTAQKELITRLLAAWGIVGVKVDSVHAGQGSESDVVIISTVRSLPVKSIPERTSDSWMRKNLGFVTDDHQINVAITRARRGLFIVGNAELLSVHQTWRDLVWYYKRTNCFKRSNWMA